MPKPDDEFRPPKVIDDAPLTIRFYGEVRGPRGTAATLVEMFDEATQIVDFFKKDEEIKRMKKAIKRAILDCAFADPALVKVVQDRFMELAKSKFA